MGVTLVQPGKYDCTSIYGGNAAYLSNYFDHLLSDSDNTKAIFVVVSSGHSYCESSWYISAKEDM